MQLVILINKQKSSLYNIYQYFHSPYLTSQMSQQQITTNLLGQGKKGSQSYKKCVQQIETQIQVLKNKNNMLQKQSDNDIDDNDIKKEIYQQTRFVQLEINKIKKMLEQFAQKFKDPTSKNKLKEMWKTASTEIQRNKIITERIVNEAPRESFLNREEKMKRSLIAEGRDARKSRGFNQNNNRRSRQSSDIVRQITFNPKGPSQVTQQQYDESQYYLQGRIQKQKNQLLNHLEQKNQNINKVMNEIALIVDQQGQVINVVTDNMNKAHQNLVSANEQLQQANTEQRKARKKYCILAVVLLVVALIVLGVIFILSNTSDTDKK